MYRLILLFLLFGTLKASCQDVEIQDSVGSNKDSMHLVIADTPAEFIGGQEAFLNYITTHLEYPDEAAENEVQGRVIIQFVVDKNGNLEDVEVLKHSLYRMVYVRNKKGKILSSKKVKINEGEDDYCLGTCAVNLVANSPKWKPAYHKGKPVKIRYRIPIRYTIY